MVFKFARKLDSNEDYFFFQELRSKTILIHWELQNIGSLCDIKENLSVLICGFTTTFIVMSCSSLIFQSLQEIYTCFSPASRHTVLSIWKSCSWVKVSEKHRGRKAVVAVRTTGLHCYVPSLRRMRWLLGYKHR